MMNFKCFLSIWLILGMAYAGHAKKTSKKRHKIHSSHTQIVKKMSHHQRMLQNILKSSDCVQKNKKINNRLSSRMVQARVQTLKLNQANYRNSMPRSYMNSDSKSAAIVFDASSGQVLFEENAHKRRIPASLTKKMTLLIAFRALKTGRINFQTRFLVSALAARQEPCKVHLKAGETVSIKDLVMTSITKSANDSMVTLAEGLAGGSITRFIAMMNETCRELGMNHTRFQNVTGLPSANQYTTAHDMLKLSLALHRDFPEYYRLFKTQSYCYKGKVYGNHNRMLGQVPGLDGLKTGFTNASMFNISTSTERDGRRIFVIVMGGNTWRARDKKAAHLIETAFQNQSFENLDKNLDIQPISLKSNPSQKIETRKRDVIGELCQA